jgi:uncharacterized protein YcaQ
MLRLTQEMVRTAMLAAQGLLSPPALPAQSGDILPIIRQMGYLQIDTIQAVRRSQYLVLWSRLGDFDPGWLDEVYRQGGLFEYYAHALCYLPIEDYPIFRGLILNDDRTGNDWHKWAQEHLEVIQRILAAVQERGPVSSLDFESQTVSTGWGDVKHEKLALNRLFSMGELMVTHRENFRRYYDLRERVLPDWDDKNALDYEEARAALLLKTIRALGAVREDWAAAYYYFLKTGIPEVLSELATNGLLIQVEVKGWDLPAYVHPDNIPMVETITQGELEPTHTTFLSPFDPLVSDRERALVLFDFDYKMESYKPAKDRIFGYFCLPILHHGRLIGRLDPKADRKRKQMHFKKVYLEQGVEIDDALATALKSTLKQFTAWHGMTSLKIGPTDPPELREALL